MNFLRAQTYDGGANMDGTYNGCQAIIRDRFPLALHFRCAAHSVHLVAQHATEADAIIRDCLQWVQEVGKLFKRSTKFHRIFDTIVTDSGAAVHSANIKPLCPTRWLCRHPAVMSAVNKYDVILESLFEMSQSGPGDTATKARGLYEKFLHGCTILGLHMAMCITGPLHELNHQLQGRKGTVSGMMETVMAVRNDLAARRSDQYFADILQEAVSAIGKLNLQPLQLSRCSRPPKRLVGPAPSYQAATVEEHFRKSFFVVLDTAIQQLDDRWQILDGTGLHVYKQLEEVLLTGTVADVVQNYADINRDSLAA